MPDIVAPSGDQFEIAFGDQRAVIVEVGGGLRTYTAGGQDVLDGYGPDEICSGGRGQLLSPWPNRVAGGRWEQDGQPRQLALTEPAAGNAIHGLVRWATWTASERDEAAVTMAYRLHPQPGWTGTLDLSVRYALDADGLSVTNEARNAGAEPCPYGTGAHPYLTVGTETVDEAMLTLPATSWLSADERGIPVGRSAVTGTAYDFTAGAEIGSAVLDTGFGDLRRDADGLARVCLVSGDGARAVTLWADAAYTHLMVFTGDTLVPDRRRRGLAVEPMSCPPNALVTGEDLVWLDPGERHFARWGLNPR